MGTSNESIVADSIGADPDGRYLKPQMRYSHDIFGIFDGMFAFENGELRLVQMKTKGDKSIDQARRNLQRWRNKYAKVTCSVELYTYDPEKFTIEGEVIQVAESNNKDGTE